ncbi:2-hydroxyacid dehydrogenase [Lacticaseibacillus baoqingensis]|uniref:2-hydroxyacid dehydrogenase n=1 Tax=Lacticaseibacillus baoqingensis TaxID=2486013 RepID=A0ABW4E488_9LACO|nr:NAD(P)-dependent oxidoreductase [Lacticaseibacillus baoqingensis]
MSKVVVLNGDVVNYDGHIDWSTIGSDVVVYPTTAEAEILPRVADATVVVTKEMPLSGAVVRQFPASVKLVVEAGTGYNNHDLDALREKGIALTNIPEYSTQRVAHTAIMLMLNLASSMQQQLTMLAHHDYTNFTQHLQVDHVELNDKTLGVIGFGHIGQNVIKIAQALDMTILVNTRTPRADRKGIHFTTLNDLLAKSDFVSLNLPLTPATQHLINAETLALMKPSSFLINTARGGLVDEPALINALQNHTIAGAGLDVQAHEPLDPASPLFTLPNVIVTPHMGWRGLETRQRLVQMIGANIEAFLAGTPINQVD